MQNNRKPVIGIDLGTTYSVVATCFNGDIEVIPNAEGQRTTPSVVGFTELESLVGDAAVSQMADNSKNTIYGKKLLLYCL